jgi:predicted flap endonuclease-1-like 5' DNA nuclease
MALSHFPRIPVSTEENNISIHQAKGVSSETKMSAHLKRGLIVWILGFLTFLAAINTLYAVMLGIEKNAAEPVNPYLIRYVIPDIPLHYYFWGSVVATCALLAVTSIFAFRRLPDRHLFWKIDKLEEGIAENAETMRATQRSLLVDLADGRKAREELVSKVDKSLADTRKETLSKLQKHEEAIQGMSKDVQRTTREMTFRIEQEHSKAIEQMNVTLEKAVKKQATQIKAMAKRVEKLEQKLLPQPKLTSQNKPEAIKGIGRQLGKELKALGITTVAELITADSRTLAKETRATRDMIKHLQTTAQLLMIPGIDENHAELLEEAGITTRKDLASQEPIQLSQKLQPIVKTYIEEKKLTKRKKPTIEEISSWIKQAKI